MVALSSLPLASAGPINGIVPSVIVLLFWFPYRARVRTLSHERRAVPVPDVFRERVAAFEGDGQDGVTR